MQRQASYDRLAEYTFDLRENIKDACRDGTVTPQEQRDISAQAHRLCCEANVQASVFRVALRLIRGGRVDRELMGEARDAQELGGVVVDLGAYRRTRRVRRGKDGGNDAA